MLSSLPVSEKKPCVDIKLSSDNGIVILKFRIFMKIINNSQINNSGYGIINLRKRLDLTYPDKHQLIIDPEIFSTM